MSKQQQPDDLDRLANYKKYYSEAGLKDKLLRVAKQAGIKVVYLVLLGYEVICSPDVPRAQKAIIFGVLGYFVLPTDLVPDFLPMVGFTDDLAAIIAAIKTVYVHITPEMKQNVDRQLRQWFGDYDATELDGIL